MHRRFEVFAFPDGVQARPARKRQRHQPGERAVINVRERMQHAHKPERADFVIGVGAHWFDHG